MPTAVEESVFRGDAPDVTQRLIDQQQESLRRRAGCRRAGGQFRTRGRDVHLFRLGHTGCTKRAICFNTPCGRGVPLY